MTEREESGGSIDLMYLAKSLLKRAWIILLSAVACAGIAFCVTKFAVDAQYSASVLLYIQTDSGKDFTPTQIDNAKKLFPTYAEILRTSDTLSIVAERAGVDYEGKEIEKMISSSIVKDTVFMEIEVTCGNAEDAAKIANTVAEVLPERVGTPMKVAEKAVADHTKVAPNVKKYTLLGGFGGLLCAVLVLSVIAALDDRIYGEEMAQTVCKYPILAKIPDLYEGKRTTKGGTNGGK